MLIKFEIGALSKSVIAIEMELNWMIFKIFILVRIKEIAMKEELLLYGAMLKKRMFIWITETLSQLQEIIVETLFVLSKIDDK